jgi:hypothetical protein
MLLSLNDSKIKELLESTGSRYVTSSLDVPTVKLENYQSAYPTTYAASGAIYVSSPLVTAEAKEHLLSARRKIETSGVRLKSVEELEAEISEMRRSS